MPLADTCSSSSSGEEYQDVDILHRIEDDMLNDPDVMEDVNSWCANSDISAFFEGKSVLVTGATGFLGLVLTEKLLRSCPGIRTLYVLVRESVRTGKDVHSRLDECFDNVLFDELRKREPKFRNRVVAVRGDVSCEDLGISDEQRAELERELQVVLHAAASVRFEERLRTAAHINVRGTRSLLQLARACPKLEAFVHVSTAYSNCPRAHIEEKVYPTEVSSEQLLQLVQDNTDEELERQLPQLLGQHPNTYTYTKQVAEQAVLEHGRDLPTCVFRPSIVVATYREPVRGWSNSVYGPMGVLIGVGTGVLRTLEGNPAKVADLVPVDMCASAIIACAWDVSRRKEAPATVGDQPLPVYNYVSSARNPITWGEFVEMNKRHGMQCPTMRCVWYYSFRMVRWRWLYLVYAALLHWLPALAVDACLCVAGRRPAMLRLYRKIQRFGSVLAYFTLRQWRWQDDQVQALWGRMSPADRKTFPIDVGSRLDWEEHASTQLLGLRLYVVKDELSTIPQAKKRWRRFMLLHRGLQALCLLLAAHFLYRLLSYVLL